MTVYHRLSQLGAGYVIDPMNDLISACLNCHALLHRKDPPYMLDEIRERLNERKNPEEYSYSNVGEQLVAEPRSE